MPLPPTRSQVDGAASHKYDGTAPVRLFSFTLKVERAVIALSSTGMVPVNEFEYRLSWVMPVIVLSSAGMVPVSAFE